MRFRDMNVNLVYDTSKSNIIEELIVPLLSSTKKYYRGVGYFSSAWIRLVCTGLEPLVEAGGEIHILTSPQLSKEDWDAIINGEKAKVDETIYRSIKGSLDNFDIKTKKETLNLFSWLIADGIMDLRFVVCKNIVGNYHDKVAIFQDSENDKICIHGSLNDSLQATYNGEGISVFKSWIEGQSDYLKIHFTDFMSLMNGQNDYFKIYEIPEMLKTEFIKYQDSKRPYNLPDNKSKAVHLPNYISELKSYQILAIEKLIQNGWQGIFEMATGTGKTITAIEATRRYIKINEKIFLVVVVPFKHLVSQWENVLTDFGYSNIVCCYKGTKRWYDSANRNVNNFNAGLQNIVCLITTYQTASAREFSTLISKVRKHSFLIADECHYTGSEKYGNVMMESFECRLGLSATPDRWFDEVGTQRLKEYFNGTVFEYNLKEAIKSNHLTRYEYIPIVVNLNSYELDEYVELTRKISRLRAIENEVKKDSALERLLIRRSSIISKAESKLPKLLELLEKQNLDENISHALIYCAAGENKKVVSGVANLNLKVHDFVYDVPDKERSNILKLFDTGDIETLVAIKCLDEGVDIPSTKVAYFLSSTSNPREFIQRRGRVLRRYPGKNKAKIYDFIVMPDYTKSESDESYSRAYQSIIFREIPRFAEFSDNAENKYNAREIIRPYLKAYGLEYLMDMLPYEIYNELKSYSSDFEEGDKCDE